MSNGDNCAAASAVVAAIAHNDDNDGDDEDDRAFDLFVRTSSFFVSSHDPLSSSASLGYSSFTPEGSQVPTRAIAIAMIVIVCIITGIVSWMHYHVTCLPTALLLNFVRSFLSSSNAPKTLAVRIPTAATACITSHLSYFHLYHRCIPPTQVCCDFFHAAIMVNPSLNPYFEYSLPPNPSAPPLSTGDAAAGAAAAASHIFSQ
jgi:hypothetical protein